MKKSLLLFVLLVCAAPVFAAPSGFAVEAFSDGTAGIGYYQPSWGVGVAGSFSSSTVGSESGAIESRNVKLEPWAQVRTAVGPKTSVFAGVSFGVGFMGKDANNDITDDVTPGIFAGVDYQLAEKFLIQGYSSYSSRSRKAADVVTTEAGMSAKLGLSYFF
jgi:hypothetical protein